MTGPAIETAVVDSTTSDSTSVDNPADTTPRTDLEVADSAAFDSGTNDDASADELGNTDDEFTIDDLLDADFSEYEEFADDVNHKGMRPLKELMQHITPDARKHVANMRSMMTRKTQEVADLRRQLETERDQLKSEREALYSGDFAKHINETAAEPETPHDLFDEEGMSAKIKQEAALMFQKMIQPMQEEMEQKEQKTKLRAFESENPLMTDPAFRIKVFTLLTERPELKPQDAFYILKGKLDASANVEAETARKAERSARRDALKRTTVGSTNSANGTPKFKNGWEAYQYHKTNASS